MSTENTSTSTSTSTNWGSLPSLWPSSWPFSSAEAPKAAPIHLTSILKKCFSNLDGIPYHFFQCLNDLKREKSIVPLITPEENEFVKNYFSHLKKEASDPLPIHRSTSNSSWHSLKKTQSEQPTVFKQQYKSIVETKTLIEREGANYTSITLERVDDELLTSIQKNCPELKTLKIKFAQDYAPDVVADKGIEAITKMEKLEELTIHSSLYIYWGSSEQLRKITESENLQQNLKKLSLSCSGIDKEFIVTLSKLKDLNALSIRSPAFNADALKALLNLNSLLPILTKLNIWQSEKTLEIDGAAVKALASFEKLQNLSLAASWKIEEKELHETLKSLPKLRTIALKGIALTSLEGIERYKTQKEPSKARQSLENFALDDWSKLTDEKVQSFLATCQHLQRLYIRDFYPTTNEIFIQGLQSQKNLQGLALINLDFSDKLLGEICLLANLRKSLKSLAIRDSKNSGVVTIYPDEFKETKQFKQLKSLKIYNAKTFTDDAVDEFSNTIENLELWNVEVSDDFIAPLTKLSHLHTLKLFSRPIKRVGWQEILTNENIVKCKNLALGYIIPFEKETIDLFANYNLERLTLRNYRMITSSESVIESVLKVFKEDKASYADLTTEILFSSN